jgi:hypothetical protein
VLTGSSYGFNNPVGITFDGAHLWITSIGGDSVTEVNASDGSLVQVLPPTYFFRSPFGIAFDGAHLWITNFAGGVTVIPG